MTAPLRNEEWELLHGDLLENHRLIASVEGEITDVGTVDNHIHVYVVDENGNDVTNYYEIIFSLGKLNVISSIYSPSELPRNPIKPRMRFFSRYLQTTKGHLFAGQILGRLQSWRMGDRVPLKKQPRSTLSLNGLALLSEGKAPVRSKSGIYGKGYPPPALLCSGRFPDGNDVHVTEKLSRAMRINTFP